ncbi:GTP-binding protein [Anaerobacillus sp. CMMVII]|uniref:dynamin family protein n=1 Tax=Anaerobacillus sp. CMMVII TaxID=2755588 RepID=UPI0021B80B6A|nr:dynamin family protein [Anaerobacillus sp. CMMVII]MCT8137675.1 GTP-binding protein [Anaerobacillus sp. CMMVII]
MVYYLKKYIDEELTKSVPPHYFSTLLEVVYNVDQESFEKLVVSLWNSYEEEELYFSWISEINRLFLKLDVKPSATWHEVSTKYHQTYFSLINGQYLIKEISDLVPNLLTNWLKLACASQSLFAATAVVAWNEFFKGSLDVEKAEQILLHAKKDPAQIEQNIEMFDEIVAWSKTNELDIDHRLKWAVEKVLDLQTSHLLVVGMAGNGKTSFLNSILGGNIVAAPPSTMVVYRNSEDIQISEITEQDTLPVLSLVDFSDMKQEEEVKTQSLVHFEMPNKFLVENRVAFMDIPDIDRSKDYPFLQLADGLLFVLTATTLFTDRERDLLLKMQEQVHNLPVHFLLRTDSIYHEQEVAKIVEEIRTRIFEYFPKARIFPYSTHNKSSKQAEELSDFIQVALHHKKLMETRNKKVLFYIREALTYLIKRRVEIENEMTEVIQWKEDIVSKLNAAVHQLSDLEKEKVKVIQSSYHTIKEDIRLDLKMAIPKLVRDCSALVKEDSDFRKIHIELNQEMNERIQNYIQHTILPRFTKAIQGWIELSSEEFFLSQDYLDEISEGFDRLYGVERLKLNCDFKVLDDWTRDANRLSNGIQLETMNILNRSTPSQLVVKSAGKLFGTFGTNKTVLANMYQKLIEKEDYEKLAATVTNQFILQFEMFEKGLERDIAMFFKESFSALHETIEEEQQDIQDKKDTLKRLKANPENYLDPITLFQVRLLQNELLQKEINMSPSFA